jgi:DNA-binding transcriptional ArsR family regulator
MKTLIPSRSSIERDPPEPAQIIDLNGDVADEVFDALSSKTSRQVLTAVYEDPKPASELADAADTSLQNTHCHLENLRDAELIEVVDTAYSAQGYELKIYGPTNRSVVVFTGDDETASSLRRFLREVSPVLGVLGVMSVIVETLVSNLVSDSSSSAVVLSTDTGREPIAGVFLTPGLLFFAGGLVVLLLGLRVSRLSPSL